MSSLPDAAPQTISIAARGSRLARRQAEIVAALVRTAHPEVAVSIVAVPTAGDRDARPFRAIGGKGLFVGEVERVVQEGRADVAVHSAKDLTADLAQGCCIVCVPPRADAADVVVGGRGSTGEERLAALPPGARVGTSSMRRRVLCEESRSDLDVVELRGNLDTRLAKVADGVVDAAILAAAGVERLAVAPDAARGDAGRPARLDPRRWVPAPGQGALAVEARCERADLAALFRGVSDPGAASEVVCERAFARTLEGGCSVPLGCVAQAGDGRLVATGYLGSPGGGAALRDTISGPLADAEHLGVELARALLEAGGDEVLAEVAAGQAPEPSPP